MTVAFECPGCGMSQPIAANASEVASKTIYHLDGTHEDVFWIVSACPDCQLDVTLTVDYATAFGVTLVLSHRGYWERLRTDRQFREIVQAEGWK